MREKIGAGARGEEEDGGVGRVHCPKCKATFARQDTLVRHMNTQHDENLIWHKCPVHSCDQQFRRTDFLRRHILTVHKMEPDVMLPGNRRVPIRTKFRPVELWICPFELCQTEVSRKDHLHRHIRKVHGVDSKELLRHWRGNLTVNSNGSGPKRKEIKEKKEDSNLEVKEEPKFENKRLCILCCLPFGGGGAAEEEDPWDNLNFSKFICEMVPPAKDSDPLELSSYLSERLSVCKKCLTLISDVTDGKSGVEEIGRKLEERPGSKKVGKWRGRLEERGREYGEKLKRLEEVVNGGNVNCLEEMVYENGGKKRRKKEGKDFVMAVILREEIINAAKKGRIPDNATISNGS